MEALWCEAAARAPKSALVTTLVAVRRALAGFGVLEFWVKDSNFGVSGSGFRVKGLGFGFKA